MAIIVDSPFDIAFKLYGLPWPDIDEDKVAEFGVQFDKVCEATVAFGLAADGLLTVLSDASKSEAFDAVTTQFQAICNRDMFPVIDAAGDTVRVTADISSKIITSYKLSLITILTTNLALDLAAMAVPGPGTAAAVARISVVRPLLRLAVHEAGTMFASLAVEELNKAFDEWVLQPIERFFADVRERLVQSLAGLVSGNASVRHATLSTAGALYIDYHDVIDATSKLLTASQELRSELDKYFAEQSAEDLSEPNYNGSEERDSLVRTAVKSALDWAVEAIVRLLADVGEAIVKDLVTLILDTYESYVEADTQLAMQARELRDQFVVVGVARPYVIDRSTRPKPLTIWENPPDEVYTGQAVSDARFDIRLIQLPDAPDPVVTGVARSDASANLNKVVLPDLSPGD